MSAPPPPAADTPGLHDNKGWQVLGVVISLPILATMVIIMRFYTRLRIIHNIAIDDWFMGIAWIFAIATSICMCYQVHYGMGRHVATLTLEQGMGSLKALFASILTYNISLTTIKLSVLMQYLRICVSKPVRRACWIFVGIIVFYGFWTVLSAIFNCIPVQYFWDERGEGKCLNKPLLWFLNAGINIVTDFSLILLPIFVLRGLMLPKRQKISLILILALGGFAGITSILRLHALYIVTISKDITWDNPGTAIWSCVELNVGIICASLPTLRALLTKFFPNAFPSRSGQTGGIRNDNYGSSSNRRPHYGMGSLGTKNGDMGKFDTLSDSSDKALEGGVYDVESTRSTPTTTSNAKNINSLPLHPLNAHGRQKSANGGFSLGSLIPSARPSPMPETVKTYVEAIDRPSPDYARRASESSSVGANGSSVPVADGQIRVVTVTKQIVEPAYGPTNPVSGSRRDRGESDSETESRKGLVLGR